MKPSVLFFCTSFTSGGVEKVLVNLANHFNNSDYSTSFLVCQHIGILDVHLSKGINIFSLNKRLLKSLFPAISFFRNNNPDVIICGPQFISILSVLVVKLILRKKVKLILSHHSFYDLDIKRMTFFHLFYKSFLRFFYRYGDIIVAVSNAVKEHLVNDVGLSKDKIKVIYNPVLESNFNDLIRVPLSHKWFVDKRDYKILVCVGRLSKIKNQEALVRLMPSLIKEINCKLVLIGDGEERYLLEKLVSDLDLSLNVEFLGSISNPLKFIKHSDLLVLPSLTETFSLVAVESIASGTPVISTPTLGVTEILENCEGCFFESIDNQNGFIFRIKEILNSENIFVDEEFVKKFRTDKIGEIYESLL
jgi:glycosyltransferase involved in cell wall biosynthesis